MRKCRRLLAAVLAAITLFLGSVAISAVGEKTQPSSVEVAYDPTAPGTTGNSWP